MHVGPLSFHVYLWLTIGAIALISSIFWLGRRPRRPLDRLIFSASAMLLGLALAIVPLRDSFGVLHVIYGVGTCAVPVVGLAIATCVIRRKREGEPTNALIGLVALCLLPAVVGVYATNVEPNRLELNTHDVVIDGLASGVAVRIGVVADIQSPNVGPFEQRAVDAVNQADPDVILYAGDLYSGEDNPLKEHRSAFMDLVKRFDAPEGVFFVPGDHDNDSQLAGVVQDGGAELLDNKTIVVNVRGIRIGIFGTGNDNTASLREGIVDLAKRSDVGVRIVLAHHPDVISLSPPGIDLVVSGHTHGGQVQLPFVGPLMTLSSVPREQAGGGLFPYPEGQQLFVTRGVGVEHGTAPKLRFLDTPEVDLLRLVPPA